jgi:hypothetical protein
MPYCSLGLAAQPTHRTQSRASSPLFENIRHSTRILVPPVPEPEPVLDGYHRYRHRYPVPAPAPVLVTARYAYAQSDWTLRASIATGTKNQMKLIVTPK